MAELKVFHDRDGATLTVWFADSSEEVVCEETGDEVILMKNKTGQVIGFEKLNFVTHDRESLKVAIESVQA